MNEIEIKGYIPSSLLDYPGKICSVIFLPNCNFRCPFCQNPDLITKPEKMPNVEIEKIFDHLQLRRKWLDGVCVTGGEPCLHQNLPEFLSKIKKLGFLVKLDTNGTNPKMLEELIEKKLVDYIAMDIKAPLKDYDKVTKVRVNKKDIQESIDLIKKSKIDYEFRTTAIPKFIGKKEIEEMGKWLNESRLYCLQQFRPLITLDKSFKNEKTYNPEELNELAEVARPFFKSVCVRGI
jgi:pyruvate formate lyase activating enzyme